MVANARSSSARRHCRFTASSIIVFLLTAACGRGVPGSTSEQQSAVPAIFETWTVDGRATGSDLWEVFICHVSNSTSTDNRLESTYDVEGVRLQASVDQVTLALQPVSEYFQRWSNGEYDIRFRSARADGRVQASDPNGCMSRALDSSSSDARGVVVVADAQHREDLAGGWTNPGVDCGRTCSADRSGRVVYLGAADFVALNDDPVGAVIPLDLVEHEIGHALGWAHSMRHEEYDSIIDVMSMSAAGRLTDSSRVHAPGVLALNRFLAGWTSEQPMVVTSRQPVTVSIEPTSLVVIGRSETTMVTIEFIAATGDDDHLDSSGIAVHLVEWVRFECVSSSEEVARARTPDAGRRCGAGPRMSVLVGPSGSTDGLTRVGESVRVGETMITVGSLDQSLQRAEVIITSSR